jgi:hypothetical protein
MGQMDVADRAWLEAIFAPDQARLAVLLETKT